MPMNQLRQPILVPELITRSGGINGINRAGNAKGTLTEAGDHHGIAMSAPVDMEVRYGAFLIIASNSGEARFTIETLGADGMETDTLWAAGAEGLTGVMGTTMELRVVEFDTPVSIPRGSMFVFRAHWVAGTVELYRVGGPHEGGRTLPYLLGNKMGATSPRTNTDSEGAVLMDADGNGYALVALNPISEDNASVQYDNTSAVTMRGMQYEWPFGCRIIGGRRMMGIPNELSPGGNWVDKIFDGDGTDLGIETMEIPGGVDGGVGSFDFYYQTPLVVNRGDITRHMTMPTTSTHVGAAEAKVASVAQMDGWPLGRDAKVVTWGTTPGWQVLDTLYPVRSVWIDQIEQD